MPGRLTVFLSDRPARRFDVDEDMPAYVIGRGSDCDIQVEHPQFSRRHARLSWQEDQWVLDDLGSKNGVLTSGRRAGQISLPESAWLQFGDIVARFEPLTAAELERDREQDRRRWETSLELRRHLDPGAGLEPLLQDVLRSILSLSGTERGFVMLTTTTGDLEIRSSRGAQPDEFGRQEFSGSVGAIDLALRSGETVVCCDATNDAVLGSHASVIAGGIRALLCLPLAVHDKTMGILYADSRQPGKVFTDLDAEILRGLVDHAAMAIAVARVREEIAGLGGTMPLSASDENDPAELATRLPVFDPARSVERNDDGVSKVTWSAIRLAHAEHSGRDT